MGKAIIKSVLQFSLLFINLDEIDIFHHNGSFVLDDFYVGERRDNKSMVVKATAADSQRFLMILEQRESGYDLSPRDIYKLKLWPKGIIPYYIDPVSYDKDYRNSLRQILTEISNLSGIYFKELHHVPKDESFRYVHFLNTIGTACTHTRFTNEKFTREGPQKVVLGFNSLSNGDMYSFVMAAAGIPPQNNGPYRDNFITIARENIIIEKLHLFDALRNDEWLYHDLPYDFESASHFHYHEFTRNGQATIKPKYDVPAPMAQGFTFYDIVKMRRTYNFISSKEFLEHAASGKHYVYPPSHIHFEGMNFMNPEEYHLNAKYNLVNANHNFKTEPKSKQSKSEKKKRPKFIGFSEDSDVKRDKNQVTDPKFGIDTMLHTHLTQQFGNEKKKGIARPKPNQYLGILGDDPAHQEEEYIPEKQRSKIDEKTHGELSEAIDVYLSETSLEEDTTEFNRAIKTKRKKKRSRNNINV